jgi:hypothetical protein
MTCPDCAHAYELLRKLGPILSGYDEMVNRPEVFARRIALMVEEVEKEIAEMSRQRSLDDREWIEK